MITPSCPHHPPHETPRPPHIKLAGTETEQRDNHIFKLRPPAESALSHHASAVADPGGGGGGGPGDPPPLLGHDVGFLTLGPKLDPPFFACRPKMQWRIQGGGVTGVITPPLELVPILKTYAKCA